MAQRGFDRIATVYDGLARLVFGNSIQHAQQYFLNDIASQSKVLILGGGTGKFLDTLVTLKPACDVWYIEASQKMLELSKIKNNHANHVHFIHGTEDSIPQGVTFDVVILNFYLDLFTDASLDVVLKKIQKALKSDALWFVTDFVEGNKWWKNILLRIMYTFFQMTCNIETARLPNWNQHLIIIGLNKLKSKSFYKGFIEATVYG